MEQALLALIFDVVEDNPCCCWNGVLAPLTSERPEVTDQNAPRATPYYAIKLNPDEDLLPTGLPLMQGTRIHTYGGRLLSAKAQPPQFPHLEPILYITVHLHFLQPGQVAAKGVTSSVTAKSSKHLREDWPARPSDFPFWATRNSRFVANWRMQNKPGALSNTSA
jgi:hypothetical protein